MKILLTGRTGQVGYELERSLQPLGELIALDRSQMDLADLGRVRDVIRTVKPDLIVNPAAYTAVDKAETEAVLARRINAEAPAVMAEEARRLGAALVHYSTDYVFDGSKSAPYLEDDPPCPVNVYGQTKLEGELAIQAAQIPYLIFRTSWVYGMRGKNFLLTVMRLAAERKELGIVADQHGAPTWCRTIAQTTAQIVSVLGPHGGKEAETGGAPAWLERSGTYHLTAQGQTTWYGFAQAILAHPSIKDKPTLKPLTTAEYPTPARRPANSVLSCDKLAGKFGALPHWESALEACRQ